MAVDLCNKLIDNDLTRKELLERVEIQKASEEDLVEICKTLAKSFNLSSLLEAMSQLKNSKAILNESVKLVDKKTNEIYGLLMFTEFPITVGSPIMMIEREISKYLGNFKQVNGHSFIIDERLRGSGIDKEMLNFNLDFLSENYDLIWIAVDKSLKTHNYWKRLGFTEIFEIEDAVFYLMPLSKKMFEDIFILNVNSL